MKTEAPHESGSMYRPPILPAAANRQTEISACAAGRLGNAKRGQCLVHPAWEADYACALEDATSEYMTHNSKNCDRSSLAASVRCLKPTFSAMPTSDPRSLAGQP